MEAKDEGETVKIYVISDDGYVTSLVLISGESDETTFIASDCEAIFVSLLRKCRQTLWQTTGKKWSAQNSTAPFGR